MTSFSVPVRTVEGEPWLLLGQYTRKGVLRAVRIEKRKKQVLDWDGHHCDEAAAEGSIRFRPKVYDLSAFS